ncbi:MAG: hypothetical protein U1F70_13230 [Candidatus Competibacteraceae bacterium]
MALYRPDGRRFKTFLELDQCYETERQRAEAERQRGREADWITEFGQDGEEYSYPPPLNKVGFFEDFF